MAGEEARGADHDESPPAAENRRPPEWVFSPVTGAIYFAAFIAIFFIDRGFIAIPVLINLTATVLVFMDTYELSSAAKRIGWPLGTFLVGPVAYFPYTLVRARETVT